MASGGFRADGSAMRFIDIGSADRARRTRVRREVGKGVRGGDDEDRHLQERHVAVLDRVRDEPPHPRIREDSSTTTNAAHDGCRGRGRSPSPPAGSPFRKAWRTTTRRSVAPLSRAVLTYADWRTSTSPDRVWRSTWASRTRVRGEGRQHQVGRATCAGRRPSARNRRWERDEASAPRAQG